MGAPEQFDYLLVGGGLQNALVVLALLERRPQSRVALVEREPVLGGNHTWCFHAGDVDGAGERLLEPLVARRWGAYEVHFPDFSRTLEETYAVIPSARLDEVVRARFAEQPLWALLTGAEAADISAREVVLTGGQRLRAEVVVDARGPLAFPEQVPAGYQKFLGLELQLRRPSAQRRPILMDARVSQRDGFHFLYLLPLDERRVLLEDTLYSASPLLDPGAARDAIFDHAARAGLEVEAVAREERGVLPLPLTPAPPPAEGEGPLRAGYQGGWFHPTTGYSLPVALRLAWHLASHAPGELFGPSWARLVRAHRRQARFCLRLNRLLFNAFAPADRHHVLERFYRLPAETVRHFYALQLTTVDRARILCGRPPRGLRLRKVAREHRP